MGEDGAKRVVVNSVGREIRTLDEEPPPKASVCSSPSTTTCRGRSRTASSGSGFNGASVMLDPQTGEVLAFTSVPAYDPNAFAAGIDRAAWAALNTDELRPLQDRAIQGRYSPGFDVQDGGRDGGARRRRHHPRLQGVLPRSRDLLRPRVPVLAAERAATAPSICATPSSSRATCTSTRSATWSASTRSTSGRRCSASARRPASICRTKSRGSCRRPSGSGSGSSEKWYAGETISVSIGQGAGVADADLDGRLHLDDRQRRHARHAAPPEGGRRRDRWKDVAAAGAAFDGAAEARDDPGDSRRPVAGGQRRAAPAAARALPGYDVSGKTGTAQVISLEGGRAAKGKTDRDLRDNGWFVFFAPRDNPQIAGVVFVEHGGHGGTRRADCAGTCSRRFSRSRKGGRCRADSVETAGAAVGHRRRSDRASATARVAADCRRRRSAMTFSCFVLRASFTATAHEYPERRTSTSP